MPRIARAHAPGAFRQVISVFTDHEFRIVDDRSRAEYLRRLAHHFNRSDWRLLSYAVMSSHIHIGAIGGHMPLACIFQALNSSVAAWLNNSQGRRGHVFADRPDEYLYEPKIVPLVIAYIHNNPVAGGAEAEAAASTWTSHRAYLGLDPAPSWLDVEGGLAACGFSATPEGRAAFDEFVRSRVEDEPVNPSREEVAAFRTMVRADTDCPLELAAPTYSEELQARWELLSPAGTPRRRRWEGDLRHVLVRVHLATGISVEAMHSRSRRRDLVAARRLYLLVATSHLGRSVTEAAGVIGRSVQSASKLLGGEAAYQRDVRRLAGRIARACWEADTPDREG